MARLVIEQSAAPLVRTLERTGLKLFSYLAVLLLGIVLARALSQWLTRPIAELEAASRLLTAQIWIKDLKADFAGMNEVWDAWTAPGAASTRATAQCEMGAPDVLVEIIVTAAMGRTAA